MLIAIPHCKLDPDNKYWQEVPESKNYTLLSFSKVKIETWHFKEYN